MNKFKVLIVLFFALALFNVDQANAQSVALADSSREIIGYEYRQGVRSGTSTNGHKLGLNKAQKAAKKLGVNVNFKQASKALLNRVKSGEQWKDVCEEFLNFYGFCPLSSKEGLDAENAEKD